MISRVVLGVGILREGCRPMPQKCRRARSVAVRRWSVNPKRMDEKLAVTSISSHTVGSASYGGSEALFLFTQPMPPDSALSFERNRSG